MATIRKAVFLQARVKSTRLKEKMLLPLGGATILQQSMRAAKQIKADKYVLLTDTNSYYDFIPFALHEDWEIETGPENDVLKRFCKGINSHNPDTVFRVCGDKVIITPDYQRELYKEFRKYLAVSLMYYTESPLSQTTAGIFMAAGLLSVNNAASTTSYDREHIKLAIIKFYPNFCVMENKKKLDFWKKDIKLTIDTEEDYQFMKKMFDDLYKGEPLTLEQIVEWVDESGIN